MDVEEVEEISTPIIVAIVVLALTTIIIIWKCWRRRRARAIKAKRSVTWMGEGDTTREVVLFIDAPDPDNPAAAASLLRHVISQDLKYKVHPHLHIVLTGRQVDLNTSKLELFKQGNAISRQAWEKNEPLHAQKVLEDSAARIMNYLEHCGVQYPSQVTIYDGGVAPCAPLSDRAHEWDFMFDRKDLITYELEDRGCIVTPAEYEQLVERYCSEEEGKRAEKILAILRPYDLTPLEALREELGKKSCEEIIVFLGGPATGLVELFGGKEEKVSTIRSKVTYLYGMFGAITPGRRTMLSNQFNAACDLDAAGSLFVENLFPEAKKYLIPTETAKVGAVMVSAENLKEQGVPAYFVDLQNLWEYTHKNTTQPMFDVLPILAFMPRYKDCFKWRRKKAVIQEVLRRGGQKKVQVFVYDDSDDDKQLLVSEPSVEKLTREELLNFLHKIWSPTMQ